MPLHKARTCVKKFEKHCGDCPPCWDRRRTYIESGVEDPTKYIFNMSGKCQSIIITKKKKKR